MQGEAAPPASPPVPSQVRQVPAPAVTLSGEPGPNGVSPVVQNRAADSVEVRSALRVQQQRQGAFVDLTGGALQLRADCDGEAPRCRSLVPGAELRPLPWAGPDGPAQCPVGETGGGRAIPIPPGTYRFVADACDGSYRVPGEPFKLGDPW